MMKKQYNTPVMEVIQFEVEDVITSSNVNGNGNETGWVDPSLGNGN